MNKIFILSGTAEQAKILARWHDMARNEWEYVTNADLLRGNRQKTLWLFGTWRNRHDCKDLIDLAVACEFKVFHIEDDRYVGAMQ